MPVLINSCRNLVSAKSATSATLAFVGGDWKTFFPGQAASRLTGSWLVCAWAEVADVLASCQIVYSVLFFFFNYYPTKG